MIGFGLAFDDDGKPVMSFDKDDSIIQNIWLSIFIKKGSFWAAPDLGSRLYLVKKVIPSAAVDAKAYIDECLKWLLDSGRMLDVTVTCELNATQKRIDISVVGHKGTGQDVKFDTFYQVV
jgi:phage gp46-like protein